MKVYKDYKEFARLLGNKHEIEVYEKDKDNVVSFTPYIYNVCSAACEFCSEQLVRDGKKVLCDEVCEDYKGKLDKAFHLLKGKKVFVSLSGKEPTESPQLLEMILDSVSTFENEGEEVIGKVMYSNLSGFCKDGERLCEMLKNANISSVECSRHHYLEEANQSIVHFRGNEKIKSNEVFKNTMAQVMDICPVKMVCVLQNKGISTINDVKKYLEFAREVGVHKVVFRELAMFNDCVENGKVASYIENNRVELMEILKGLDDREFLIKKIQQGYYYFSFIYDYFDMEVSFEMSDYEEMIKKHKGDTLYKLILYPDGKLCTDWNMNGEIDLDELIDISKKLCEGAECALIGSMALYLNYPGVINTFPKDTDLFAEGSKENIIKIISILKGNGYQVKSWQDVISEEFDHEMLKGRYYIRGTKGYNIVDVTYEIDGIKYQEMKIHEKENGGIRFYDKEGMIAIMDKCPRDTVVKRKEALEMH